MFKLQRLEITGFKSFADYTEVVFTGNGITAVVGPNGCGKSNVSESIAWVLGEQRAKALRGSEMKDVVFQGTKARKASGMAEVVLHMVRDDEMAFIHDEEDLSGIDEAISELDENAVDVEDFDPEKEPEAVAEPENTQTEGAETESEPVEIAQAVQVGSAQLVEKKIKPKRHWRPRSFALDFAPGEAIAVTRRLYLSGESEYLLNGKTCRLRDIQDLFAGTGLSGSHYAIIEQGRIGQILSAKPSDRRNLIEEAAGISKFRTRQRAAESRLESAKSNLSRISDIVSEIEKQANSLRRQAAKTRRYKIMREEFRLLLKQLFTAEGKFLSTLVGELETQLKEAGGVEHGIFRLVGEKEEAFREATQNARLAEEKLAEIRQKHAEHALERDRNERERAYRLEQIDNLKLRAAVLENDITTGAARIAEYRSEIDRLKKDEQKELAEAEKASNELKSAEEKYRKRIDGVRGIESRLETIRNEVIQHTAAFERFNEIERQLEHNLERLTERGEGLVREGIRAQETLNDHTAEVLKLENGVKEKREKITGLYTEKQSLVNTSAEARTNLQAAERTLNDLRNEFSRKKNRLDTLRELDEKRAVYAPAVQKLFAEQSKIGVKFQGTLADRLTVDERAEKAVESLFGSFLQTVLVESESDARKTVKYLAENNLGRIAVLVAGDLSRAKATRASKDSSRIAELLGAPDALCALLSELFPREMNARMIETIADSEESLDNAVDARGDVSFGGKLFIAGKSNAGDKNTSLLAFKRELRELESAIENSRGAIVDAEHSVEAARRALAGHEEELVDLQSLIVQVERDLLGLEIQEKTARQETERAERHKRVVAEEAAQIEKETIELTERRLVARESSKKADAARRTAESMFAEVSLELSDARAGTDAENVILNEKRTFAATSEERRRSVQSALRRVENEAREYDARRANQMRELEETHGKQSDLTNSIAQIEQTIAAGLDLRENEQNELAAANEHLTNARESADTMSTELAELNKNSADARNARATLEIRQTEAVTKLRSLNENCTQELNASLAELVETEEIEPDFILDDARGQVADLRERLENFGAINMLALEELSETEERLLFLTSQRQDIIDSIRATEEALREIKERSRERFKQAFEAINANFSEFFMELFGGGRGEMTLQEAEDILEAGIEVVAQPPGKRLQNILLLSGGEKAMTAIALVMAIFKYRPSPFCLLDEVDAPLDDANVGRFVDTIAQMAEKTQFIVITHNKRTMEAARALYGVTMQEAGVSKVVSVRFE
ncbi:MAG: chromosome segregation protein SMC [Acidobacteria bacterium]|nr:chromosome segregation protein SMC [Acidobacteriota bacterium]